MRSDSDVLHDVREELDWEPSVGATHIEARVDRGRVTLTGTVGSYFAKWNADDAVRRISGVTGILNNAKVVIDTHDRHQEQKYC